MTGEPGTGKTYMYKELQQKLLSKVKGSNGFRVCTPTHKSPLIANAITAV